jgi:translation initiation factor 3 subunit I
MNTLPVKQYRGCGFMTLCKLNNSKTILYIADKDSKIITAVDIKTFTIIGTFNGHNGVVWHISLTNDDKILCSCSGDMNLNIWNAENGILIKKINQKGIPKILAINENNILAIYNESINKSKNSFISFVNLNDENYETINEMQLNEKITTLLWNSNNILIKTLEDGKIVFFNLDNNIINEIQPHNNIIKSLVYNKFKTHLLTGSLDGTSKIININTLQTEKTFISNSPINYANYLGNEKKIVLGGGIEAMFVASTKSNTNDLRTKIYNVKSQKLVLQIQSHFGPIRYIDTVGKICITASQDGSVKIHNVDIETNFSLDINNSNNNNLNNNNNSHTFVLFGNALLMNNLNLNTENIKYETYEEMTYGKQEKETQEKTKEKYIVGLTPKPSNYNDNTYVIETKNNDIKKSIKISNLPSNINYKILEEIFECFGKIETKGIKIINNAYDTFAFINFSISESALKAVEHMHRQKFENNIIHVEIAN